MISSAVAEIHRLAAQEESRRQSVLARRADVRRLDGWLETIETMLEADRRQVPEPLVKEISGFLREVDPKLQRAMIRNRTRDAARVLDILFDAQEYLLPGQPELTA